MSKPDPSRVFSALGDPTRLRLLARLSATGGLPLGQLVADCGITRQGATKHLKVLEAAGLVEAKARGRERLVTIRPGGLTEAQSHLGRIARGWEETLVRLRDHVERRQ